MGKIISKNWKMVKKIKNERNRKNGENAKIVKIGATGDWEGEKEDAY